MAVKIFYGRLTQAQNTLLNLVTASRIAVEPEMVKAQNII
ncbi:hypothetical protein OSCI_2750006 [Kamptonema sp. PCC 6506]|nr:hypothetical protein OSCI_2750006 [Kamptonema sp. PCC 6506]